MRRMTLSESRIDDWNGEGEALILITKLCCCTQAHQGSTTRRARLLFALLSPDSTFA